MLRTSDDPISGPQYQKLRVVCLSDTHNTTPPVPNGDILIHAGDLSNAGTPREVSKALDYLERASDSFSARILIGGNHDLCLDKAFCESYGVERFRGCGEDVSEECESVRERLRGGGQWEYFAHEKRSVTVRGSKMVAFGSPFSRRMGKIGKWAFSYADEQEAQSTWSPLKAAQNVDVVIVHGPPFEICDNLPDGKPDGCEELLKALESCKPKLVVCGHRHEGRGCAIIEWNGQGGIRNVYKWIDESIAKKISLVDLTGKKLGKWVLDTNCGEASGSDGSQDSFSLVELLRDRDSRWTCVVNAAIMAHSYTGGKRTNKAIVVDMEFAVRGEFSEK